MSSTQASVFCLSLALSQFFAVVLVAQALYTMAPIYTQLSSSYRLLSPLIYITLLPNELVHISLICIMCSKCMVTVLLLSCQTRPFESDVLRI